jgi:hypothetical protein
MEVNQKNITQFLVEFKKMISTGQNFYFIGRPENNSAFISLGLTWSIFIKELLGLSVVDYSTGPDPDRDIPGDIWVFGKEINGHEVYIKLRLFYDGSEKKAKCISFHEADYPIKYPFRK